MNLDIFQNESLFKKVLDSKNTGVEQLENFNLYERGGIYFPGTVVSHKDFLIISGNDGKIMFYSFEHRKSHTFDGAGGEGCVQIMAQDNVLY